MAKLWFFLVLLLSSGLHAQSIPATPSSTTPELVRYVSGMVPEGYPIDQTYAATALEACQRGAELRGWTFHSLGSPNVCKYLQPGQGSFTDRQWANFYRCGDTFQPQNVPACEVVYSCPSGYTLNGTMCDPEAPCPMFGTPEGNTAPSEKPASCNCPEGTVWVPMNGCRAKCNSPYSSGEVVNAGWPFYFPPGQQETCFHGCIVQAGGGESFEYDDGTVKSPATQTGWACQTSSETPPPDANEAPEEPKEPPCPATHGVLTSSSGTVACVPNGTPSPRKPDVEVREKKETYPDNSEKVTKETKTTDPKTGASHTSTSTTSTGGQAGPAGTSSSSETSTGKGTGGDGGGDCEGEDCGEGDEYEPGEMPSTEGLYEKQYEDGISGVLNARFSEMQDTPLFGLVGKLIPTNLPSSGSCAPFSFSMNLGPGMNLGAGTLEVPCYVWDFIRLVMYISALLLARRLIFGG